MRIVVIGATGHVGGYLVPRLVRDGHEVVAVSRGGVPHYIDDSAWSSVQSVRIDREAEESAGTFGARIAELDADVVVDLICFTESSAEQLVESLRGRVRMLVHIGTIWVHGALTQLPATEAAPRHPWGEYGTQKASIERLLAAETASGGLATAVVHPGHISGPGWPVINPIGNLDLEVWRRLAMGETVAMPHLGAETVHHVHAADVAQLIQLCIEQPDASTGESFHAVSERALSLRGFAQAVASWFGRTADLRFVSFDDFRAQTTPEHADASYEHIVRSHAVSIEKARERLGYRPAYTSLAAVAESLQWLRGAGTLDIPEFTFAESA